MWVGRGKCRVSFLHMGLELGVCRLDLCGRRSIGLRVGMGIRLPGGLGRSQGERLDPLSCVSYRVHDTIVF